MTTFCFLVGANLFFCQEQVIWIPPIMEHLVAPVTNITFDLEVALSNQAGVMPLPFPGMDKSGAPVCELYVRAICQMGTSCPFRHVRGDKAVVCKHWLRGLCKKGDGCEFLHEYDMTKMPECYFYTRFSEALQFSVPLRRGLIVRVVAFRVRGLGFDPCSFPSSGHW